MIKIAQKSQKMAENGRKSPDIVGMAIFGNFRLFLPLLAIFSRRKIVRNRQKGLKMAEKG